MKKEDIPPKNERCKTCPYPATGFICWRKGEDCLRQTSRKIFGIKEDCDHDKPNNSK